MPYTPRQFIGHALETDSLDGLGQNEDDLGSVDEPQSPVLLNGMTILFDKAVPVSPVNLAPKAKLPRHRRRS
ncbi:MAG: hypothetical protein QNJ46_05765 [Leptolyngbyaceae cyanobacterium MO_188.B28]|nr:hypothetical protein [Leptolyngbyaceae cyanobacterium MO_188.B28]